MHEFCLPDLGEGLTSASVVAWSVEVGDMVTVDQTVVEVETTKARVEIPIPFGGVVTTLHATEGELVGVGHPLITVDSVLEHESADTDGSDAIGFGTSGPVLVGFGKSLRGDGASEVAGKSADISRVSPVVSPAIRRLARERGINLKNVSGTGPGGAVTRRDIESLFSSGRSMTADKRRESDNSGKSIPLKGLAGTRAEKYSLSRREIPEVTVWVDVDATRLLELCDRRINDRGVSPLSLVAYFASLGLVRYPELNSRICGDEIVQASEVNLGVATSVSGRLVVPVVNGVECMIFDEFANSMQDALEGVRGGRQDIGLFSSGTFTVNDYSQTGVDGATAIINYPEVAILGIGRMMARPWAVGDAVTVRQIAQLTLSFDHRACDGDVVGDFMRFIASCIEFPDAIGSYDSGATINVRSDSDFFSIQQADFINRLNLVDETDRRAVVMDLVLNELAVLLGWSNIEKIDTFVSFKDFGLSSKKAVILRNRLIEVTGLRLPSTVTFDYPVADELCSYILEIFAPAPVDIVSETLADLNKLRARVQDLKDPADIRNVSKKISELSELCGVTEPSVHDDLVDASDEALFAEIDNRF